MEQNYFKQKGISTPIIYMTSTYLVWNLLLFLFEREFFSSLANKFKYNAVYHEHREDVDSDVANHAKSLHSADKSSLHKEYLIVIRDLVKSWKEHKVINRISLGLRPYECFGILGTTGAGKSVLLQMIVGYIPITSGEIWVNGLEVKRHKKQIQPMIGYCSQKDIFPGYFTVRQTLNIFLMIRGVPKRNRRVIIEQIADLMGLSEKLLKKNKTLSVGDKRKLALAVALTGDPPILVLDEPTAGLDPELKLNMWTILIRLRGQGKCIVLATHNMEECEVLCSRLAVMVNGKFRCLGSIEDLRSKFAAGCTLIIKVSRYANEEEMAMIEEYIRVNLEKAEIRDKYQHMLSYYIDDTTVSWSKLFGIMETAKDTLNVEDYSLGKCSLEQVLLSVKFCCQII